MTSTDQHVLKYLDVNMTDIFEYDTPETVPEWGWVEQHSRWQHLGNGEEAGVWEFMVPVSVFHEEAESVPPVLKPFFEQAALEECLWIMFNQG